MKSPTLSLRSTFAYSSWHQPLHKWHTIHSSTGGSTYCSSQKMQKIFMLFFSLDFLGVDLLSLHSTISDLFDPFGFFCSIFLLLLPLHRLNNFPRFFEVPCLLFDFFHELLARLFFLFVHQGFLE